jgi:NTE family protein
MPETQNTITAGVFTASVQPLLEKLNAKFPNGIQVSDVIDDSGRQYIDLVQEGGGVFGIALAGYTYILEKMNISFSKMAGTSAGSINSLLLASVVTKREAVVLGMDPAPYHDTRSEKVLEYLAAKDLSQIVDGHPTWRKIILSLTSKIGIKKFMKQMGNWKITGVLTAILFVLLLLCQGIFFLNDDSEIFRSGRWAVIAVDILLVICIAIWVGRGIFLRLLYKHSERLGINPGKDFQSWIDKILRENKIESVKALKDKIANESQRLTLKYRPCKELTPITEAKVSTAGFTIPESKEILDISFDQLLTLAKNNSISVDYISERLQYLFPQTDTGAQNIPDDAMDSIINAFEQRTCNAISQTLQGPGSFTRELVIVSSDLTNQMKVEFPGMHRMYWGDDWSVSPSSYVRASMSVPLFFKPFQVFYDKSQMDSIETEWKKYTNVYKELGPYAMFVDGGVLSNFPINVFNDPTIPMPRKPTIGVKLEYNDSSASDPINSLGDFAKGIISTMRFFYDRDFLLKNEMYRNTVRTVDTGSINWLNFGLTNQEQVELFFRGALTATLFLLGYDTNSDDAKAICNLGNNVPFPGGPFSIYSEGHLKFESEDMDPLLGDVRFDWNQYKRKVIRALVNKPAIKKNLKTQASFSTK